MSDAPERIWAKTYVDETKAGYWEGAPILPNNPENQGVEYLRADLHAAEVEALRAERDRYLRILTAGAQSINDNKVRADTAEAALAASEAKVARLERALWAMLEHTADMNPLQGDDETDPDAVRAARATLTGEKP